MPGSFKPPHLGHLGMAIELAKKADEVLIFVSSPQSAKSKRLLPNSGAEITYDKAIELWEFMINNNNVTGDIRVVRSNSPSASPITVLEELMKEQDERSSYNDYEFNPSEYQKFYVGMSDKDAKSARFDMYAEDPRVEQLIVPALTHSDEYKRLLYSFVNPDGRNIEQHSPEFKKYANDLEMNARNLAMQLISKNKRQKVSANNNATDIAKYLSKANASKVLKLLKSLPSNLDPNNFSATDLRLLLDLKSEAYDLPVDKLIEDFVGTGNVEGYLNIIFNQSMQSLKEVVNQMILTALREQMEENMMAGGAIAIGGGGSKPLAANRDEDEEDDDEVNEVALQPSEAPIQPGLSSMTVTVIPSSKHKPGTSDAKLKKSVKNRFKIDSSYTNKRAPYYNKGDIKTDLVEKVLRNIIRSN